MLPVRVARVDGAASVATAGTAAMTSATATTMPRTRRLPLKLNCLLLSVHYLTVPRYITLPRGQRRPIGLAFLVGASSAAGAWGQRRRCSRERRNKGTSETIGS